MRQMSVTIVGGGIAEILDPVFDSLDLYPVKPIKKGTLGNFNTLTYIFELDEQEIIRKRRDLMQFVAKESTHLVGMYRHGGWMDIFVFRKSAMKL